MNNIKGIETPRIYTPPLRELTPDTTLGFEMIDFADQVLHISLHPWQKWLLIHAFEVVGDAEDGWRLRFRNVQVLVGRQNGKTTLGCVVALYFLYQLCVGLVLGTAQDVSNAEDTWQMCVELAQGNPELEEAIKHVWYTNGSKRLQLTGNRDYRVRASNRKAGRGKSADLVLMDELREHQTWEAWAALSKTGMARKNSLIWCMSNAGDGTSVVLRHFRLRAHARLGDPDGIVAAMGESETPADDYSDGSALGLFEWSADPNADPGDINAWAQANPSLGYTIELETIRQAYADDPVDVFKTECLCQWVTAVVTPPFPVDAWEAGKDEKSEIDKDSPLWWGVDIAADRSKASIAVCGKRKDGEWHAELAEYRPGTGWLAGWFLNAAPNYKNMKVALQSRGAPIASMMDIIAAIDGVEIIECAGKDVAGWCGRIWDAVASCVPDSEIDAIPIHHITQPALDLAANVAAIRPMGDGSWAWDRNKSVEDISPLVAITMAFGAATAMETTKTKLHESVYQERGVIVL
jgi:phage terminase large subunit-like protein